MGGPLVLDRAKPGQIVPVDSEHSALAQCLRVSTGSTGEYRDVRRLVLTASGGPVPGPQPGGPGERDPGGGAGAPDLGHGPGHHHQLRDPGQQGPRGDRGAPAVRHPLRPDRRRGAPDERRALDGGVRRRLHDRAGQPAHDADPDRPRADLARPGPRDGAGSRLDQTADVGLLPPRRRGLPRRVPGPGGRPAGRHGARGLQRRQRGGCGGLPGGQTDLRPDRRHDRGRAHRARRTLGGASLSVEDVVDADEWARRRAAEVAADQG